MVYRRNRSVGVNEEPFQHPSWVNRVRYLIVLLSFLKDTAVLRYIVHVYPEVLKKPLLE
jgi:hypothetical protein